MDMIGARHDRDPGTRLALVPSRQVAVVDPAVALAEGQRREQVPGVHMEVVAHVVAGPALAGYGAGVLRPDHDRAMPARYGVVVGDRAHRRADAVEDALRVVGDVV